MTMVRFFDRDNQSDPKIPVWSLYFRPEGLQIHDGGTFENVDAKRLERFANEVKEHRITDIFFHAHGINVEFDGNLGWFDGKYYRYFECADLPPDRRIAVVEVNWPSVQSFGDKASQIVEIFGADAGFAKYEKLASNIGAEALAPFLADLANMLETGARPRFHLVAHSLGTRLMSFALAGLKGTGNDALIESVFLLQPAIKADIFAGELQGQGDKVRRSIAATYSRHDGMLKLFTARAHKTPVGWDGFEGVGSVRFQGGDFDAGPGPKFIDIDCNSLIQGHDDYDRRPVVLAHLIIAGLARGSWPKDLGVAVHPKLDEAKRRAADLKAMYGNGVSNLITLQNDTRQTLTLVMADSWCGEYSQPLPSVIPPGASGAFFHHHPDGSMDGSWGSCVYRIGSDGPDVFLSFRAAYTVGFKKNKVYLEIRDRGHWGEGPQPKYRDYLYDTKLPDSGYDDKSETDRYVATGHINEGDSPETRFIIKEK